MGVYREEAEKTSDAITKITKCILEDGTIYEYILCSETKDNNSWVNENTMKYLGIGRIYSIGGTKVDSSRPRSHFWGKK